MMMMMILVPQACDIPSASNSNLTHLETYMRRESNKGSLSATLHMKTRHKRGYELKKTKRASKYLPTPPVPPTTRSFFARACSEGATMILIVNEWVGLRKRRKSCPHGGIRVPFWSLFRESTNTYEAPRIDGFVTADERMRRCQRGVRRLKGLEGRGNRVRETVHCWKDKCYGQECHHRRISEEAMDQDSGSRRE